MQHHRYRSTLLVVILSTTVCASAPSAERGQEQEQEQEQVLREREAGTNRLIHESSPYLLLHARNPVDWYPWGEEAIERARELDRPIFLSIGYSTCYWCYRMEDDVFEKPEIAAIMNDGFVSIKVDREERPDLDEIYMTATQLMTRQGGWPNSVFLTPELEPFFAGTYFPPEDRGQTLGFPTVLRRILDMWNNDRPRIEDSAAKIAEAMRDMVESRGEPSETLPGVDAVASSYDELAASFDQEWGGFTPAPKFPNPANLSLLLDEARRGNDPAEAMLLTTLHRMAEGTLYDHLEGGFHRYATDREWRVPHFEKMLYDNAALAEIYLDAARITGDETLGRFARGTLDFVLERMTGEDGGFLSAIDAQTDGHEGAYYIFSPEEIESALSPDELALLGPIFGLDREPNFEERFHTLYLTAPLREHAERLGMTSDSLLRRMEPALDKLRAIRQRREFPLVDDKVLTDWNGMMIAAMAKGGEALGEDRYREAATRAGRFVLDHLGQGEVLQHSWRDGVAKVDAFADDYAFLMKGLIELHRVTGDTEWLDAAEAIADELEARLRDAKGGYYQSPPQPLLLFQSKNGFDGATPSGNGVATQALLDLAELTGKGVYRARAEAAVRAFASELDEFPAAAKTLALAAMRLHRDRPDFLARAVLRARFRSGDAPTGDWRPFSVSLDIEPGWHVNANPASSPNLIPTRVEGNVRAVVYPSGEEMRFSFSEESLSVYSGDVELKGEIREGSPALTLVYQPCDDTRCLSPVEKEIAVP